MRPRTLDEMVGQGRLLGTRSALRKAIEAVAATAGAKDPAAPATPDASFYQTLTAPRGTVWAGARGDDSNLPPESRQQLVSLRSEAEAIRQSLSQPIPDIPADYASRLAKNDFDWAAKNRDRILAEWSKRYESKAAPK